MPYKDWLLEANEEESEAERIIRVVRYGKNSHPLSNTLKNRRFVEYILNSLFVDYGDDEKYSKDAFETNDFIKVYEWHKIDRRN